MWYQYRVDPARLKFLSRMLLVAMCVANLWLHRSVVCVRVLTMLMWLAPKQQLNIQLTTHLSPLA